MAEKSLSEELLSRADIVDVISSYIDVIQKGRNFVAICPFHDDHHPSMSISREKQIFKCYSCGHGGNALTFIRDYEKISYSDAMRHLAELIHYDDPRLHEKQKVVKTTDPGLDVLYRCAEELAKFYQYALTTEEGKIARDYLANRGINEEQIAKFRIGYAFNDGKLAIDYLQNKGFSLKNIENIGIALSGNEAKDNNSGRIIFPLFDIEGKVIGYSARRLTDDKETPKYINTSETKIFHKSNLLYNFHNANNSFRRDGYIYVLEGFMDVIALDSIGINSAVALMGTALTKEHIDILKRSGAEIRMCLDGDRPGKEATVKAIALLDKAGVHYRVVYKDNEMKDPDEILHQDGADTLKDYLNTLIDSFSFLLSYYTNISPLNNKEDAKKVIAYFVPLFANVNDDLIYDDYLYKLARATSYDSQALRPYLAKLIEAYKNKEKLSDVDIDIAFSAPAKSKLSVDKSTRKLKLNSERLLTMMLKYKEAIEFYETEVGYFYDDVDVLVANFLLEFAETHDEIDIPALIASIEAREETGMEREKLTKAVDKILELTSKEDIAPFNRDSLVSYKEVIDKETAKIDARRKIQASLKDADTINEQARIISKYGEKKEKELTMKGDK